MALSEDSGAAQHSHSSDRRVNLRRLRYPSTEQSRNTVGEFQPIVETDNEQIAL